MLESYLSSRQFYIADEDAKSFQHIQAVVPQSRTYPLADMPTDGQKMTTTFADDISILSMCESQPKTNRNFLHIRSYEYFNVKIKN